MAKRLTGTDTRTPGERTIGLVQRAISPDKKQNRSVEDSPTRMAVNRAATDKRLGRKPPR